MVKRMMIRMPALRYFKLESSFWRLIGSRMVAIESMVMALTITILGSKLSNSVEVAVCFTGS